MISVEWAGLGPSGSDKRGGYLKGDRDKKTKKNTKMSIEHILGYIGWLGMIQ